MADTHKLDEALDRFEGSLRQFEAALARRTEKVQRADTLEGEVESLRRERLKLGTELDDTRARASTLTDANRVAVNKIDAAMARIRIVMAGS